MLSFLQSWGLCLIAVTLLISQECPGNNIIPQGAGMPLTRSHRLVPIQFHQGLLNLLFTDNGGDFTIPTPSCSLRESRDTDNLMVTEGKELTEHLSLLHICCHQFSLLIYQGYIVLGLFFQLMSL